MSSIKNLEDLFQHMLQDMLYAENKITKALPKMAKKTSDQTLKASLEQHLEETRTKSTNWKKYSRCAAMIKKEKNAKPLKV